MNVIKGCLFDFWSGAPTCTVKPPLSGLPTNGHLFLPGSYQISTLPFSVLQEMYSSFQVGYQNTGILYIMHGAMCTVFPSYGHFLVMVTVWIYAAWIREV